MSMLCPVIRYCLSSCLSRAGIRVLRHGSGFLLLSAIISSVSAQQQIPPDIAARDRQLADQMNRNTQRTLTVEQQEQMQRATNDQRLRFYYETWLEENWKREWGLVFLPPPTPPMATPFTSGLASDYPAVLLDVVGESFFMVFSGTHVGNLLDDRQLHRVSRYRETRDRLVAALRAKLADLADAPPDQRTRALTDFASTQAKALRKLEAEAESLREEFSYRDDGSALLRRRDRPAPGEPGAPQASYSPLLAAQFHPGLSIDQRQLLQAIAEDATARTDEDAASAHVFFLPATARIRWPLSDDPNLTGHMQRFQTMRQTLAEELTRSIIDSPASPSRRQLRKHYTAMTMRQTPQFDELHRLAEEIRVLLVNARYPDQPSDHGLPPELVRLTGEHNARRLAFQNRTQHLLQYLGRYFAPEKLRLGSANNEPVIEVEAATDSAAQPKGGRKKLLGWLQQANEWLSRTYRELQTEAKTVSEAIRRHHETIPLAQAPAVRELTNALVQAHLRGELWRRYADYRTAVLTPGLSPAQRRLLFNAALRDLEKHRLQAMD